MRLVYALRDACRALLRPCAVEVVATLMGVQKGKEIDCNISLPLSLSPLLVPLLIIYSSRTQQRCSKVVLHEPQQEMG